MNHSNNRPNLSDILNGNGDSLRSAWNSTEAATDFAPLPAGEYACRVLAGELRKARTGTPEYSVTFEVIDGDHIGRRIWHSLYLTPAALAMSKRDLKKLGISSLEQTERPLPKGMLATVRVTLRKGDDGVERNKVGRFDVTGVEAPDPFDPDAQGGTNGAAVPKSEPPKTDSGGSAAASPTMFNTEPAPSPKSAMTEGL